MATFTDTFNRANGAPGGNWVTVSGTPTIENTWLRNSTAGVALAYETTLQDGGRHQCTTRLTLYGQGSNHAGPVVKWNTATGTGYLASIVYDPSVWYLRIYRGSVGVWTQLASLTLSAGPPTIYTITLVWDNGTLTASATGCGTLTVDDAVNAGGDYMGVAVHYNLQLADWVTMVTGAAPAFDVSPAAIPNYGASTVLTFTGTNTEWGTGTPGSPTFTCDHGSLSSQEVTAAGSATAIYSPGDYLGPVVFTDPSTGLTDTCVVTSDIGVVPPGGTTFSQDVIDYLERSATAETNPTIANREMNIATSGPSITLTSGINTVRLSVSDTSISGHEVPDDTNLAALLVLLWDLLNDRADLAVGPFTPASGIPLMQQLDEIRQDLNALRTGAEWNLDDLALVLGGSPVATHQQILLAIDGIQAGSNQDVLDALAAYFGANPPTIEQLGTMVSDIATAAGYTLGDVLDAISDTQTAIASVGTAVSTMSGNLTNGVQAILDAIDAIQPSEASPGAPIWPGLAGVTFGTAVALAGQVTITEAMDGVRVVISAVDQGTLFYRYGTSLGYRKIGALAFFNDNGDLEVFQALNFEQAFYTPRTMRHAAGVKLFTQHVASGTVQPWTVTP